MLPRGWWRPVLLYGGIAATFLVVARRPDPALLAISLAGVSPLLAFILLRSALPPGRFLRGLRDAGERVHVERDEIGWWGDRRIAARTELGAWSLDCHAGSSVHFHVRGPTHKRARRILGNPRRAGRAAAHEARAFAPRIDGAP